MAKNEQTLIVWRTIEFEHYERGFGWYLILHILAVLLIGYEIYTRDYFGATTLFVVYIVAMILSRHKPEEIDVTVTNRGIKLDTYHIPFTAIKRFWIVDHEHAKDLHLETTAYLNRFVIIPLRDQDPEEVSDVLSQHIPETEPNKESLSRKIARKIKF